MQAAVQDFAAEQIHENSETSEEDGEPQKEKLKRGGEDVGILAEIGRMVQFHFDDRFRREKNHGQERQQINPEATLGKKRLAHLEAKDGHDLSDPKRVHRPASSEPIRYS